MQINKDLIIEGTGKSLYDLTVATKQGTTVSKNNTSDIAISGNKVIHSTTLTINSGKVLMIGSLYLKHDGGTPQIQFFVDGSNYGGFLPVSKMKFILLVWLQTCQKGNIHLH